MSLWPETESPLAVAWRGARSAQKKGVEPDDARYQTDPVGWIVDRLGVPEETLRWSLLPEYADHEWDGTPDPLAAVLEALAQGRNVGVESATGTGKTFLGACVVLWFLACWEDAIVVTAAPKEAQLKLHVWKEVGRLWPRFQRLFPEAVLIDGKVRMRDSVEDRETWAATAFVCGVGATEASATKAQGFHAEHMLIITEETPGIHPAIMVAFENTSIAPHNLRLAFGNPDHQEDELHRFCLSPDVAHIRVSAYDHPNYVTGDDSIVPGAVGRTAVERREQLYAHTPAILVSRLRGISPKQAAGVALRYHEADHTAAYPLLVDGRFNERAQPFAGIDFGSWRFALTLWAPDEDGRVHGIDSLFSQREETGKRAEALHAMLTGYGLEKRIPIWGDAANQQEITDINAALRDMDSPHRVIPVAMENKIRKASVDRLNDMLGRKALLFVPEYCAEQTWFLGMTAASAGKPQTGSRLLWEIRNWRYPTPKPDEPQKQDPDDNTADGADAIASMWYAIMSWWSAAKPEPPEPPRKANYDWKGDEHMKQLERLHKKLRTRTRRAF